jgi:polar amino acid transport system substrate-binding protein
MSMRLSVAISILLFSSISQASDSVTFAMSDALEMPFINQNQENPKGLPGILAEWNAALAKQLGKKPIFGVYPSKRIVRVMEDGSADALCYVLPQWLPPELANKLIWSPPFLTDQERVVFRHDQKPITQLSDLHGIRLGTVLGYKYAALQSDLDAKKILRDDAPSEVLSFEKLFHGRYHHLVAHEMTTAWYRKTEPRMKSYFTSSYVVTDYQAKCAFSPKLGLSEQDLKSAFAELEKRGVMTEILQKYR